MSAVPHTANIRDFAGSQAPTTAWCQSARVHPQPATGSKRCLGATQDTASLAALGHLRVGVWVAANPMDSNVEPVLISAK